MLLRTSGLFSSMVLNHDLKLMTGNPRAEINNVQAELLKKIGLSLSPKYARSSIDNFQLRTAPVSISAFLSPEVLGLGRP